jgi:cytoskeletal protein CcmA (bactofilin family)
MEILTSGLHNTVKLKHRSNFSFKNNWIKLYTDSVIDTWHVGSFSSATYFITVEFDSNQKETMQVLVVARPDAASFTVYGRTSIDAELITINASVSNSFMNLTASVVNPMYIGARLSFAASYIETIIPLQPPIAVSSTSGSGGSSPVVIKTNYGKIQVLGQPDVNAESESDSITFLSDYGIDIISNNDTKAITFNAAVDIFKNIHAGANTLVPTGINDTLSFTGGSGIAVSASVLTKSVIISATGELDSLTVDGDGSLVNLTASGNISTTGNISVDGNVVIAGNNTITGNNTVAGNTVVNNLTVNGNFTINGTNTTLNSSSLAITDYNITLAQGATSSQTANGAGITIAGSLSSLLWDYPSSSWQINKSLTPSITNNFNLGSDTAVWQNIYASTINGTLAVGPQTNITAIGTLSNLSISGATDVGGTLTALSNVVVSNGLSVTGATTFTNGFTSSAASLFSGGLTSTGLTTLQQTRELFVAITPTSSAAFNFTNGGIYYCTGMNQNFTAAYTNVPTASPYVLATSVVLVQGGTAYMPTSLSINGIGQTIKWFGGSIPSGNASKVGVVGFTFIITSTNVYTVLGSYAEYS